MVDRADMGFETNPLAASIDSKYFDMMLAFLAVNVGWLDFANIWPNPFISEYTEYYSSWLLLEDAYEKGLLNNEQQNQFLLLKICKTGSSNYLD